MFLQAWADGKTDCTSENEGKKIRWIFTILMIFDAVGRGHISCDGTNQENCDKAVPRQTAGHCSGKRVWQGRQPLWIWKGLL